MGQLGRLQCLASRHSRPIRSAENLLVSRPLLAFYLCLTQRRCDIPARTLLLTSNCWEASNSLKAKNLRRCAVPVPLGLTPEPPARAEECFLAAPQFTGGFRHASTRIPAALDHKTSRPVPKGFRIVGSAAPFGTAPQPPRSVDPF